ncbi:Hypothetical_protein [Hexamita inflata]|uniref:Hypothetical_protein n=1 Tax=Hexamita inflata TaxID=28002 RepID=A0ABP1GXI8_9EUKA
MRNRGKKLRLPETPDLKITRNIKNLFRIEGETYMFTQMNQSKLNRSLLVWDRLILMLNQLYTARYCKIINELNNVSQNGKSDFQLRGCIRHLSGVDHTTLESLQKLQESFQFNY